MSTVTAVPIAPTKRSYLVWLWIGIAVAVAAAAALAWVGTSTEAVRASLPNDKFLAANKRQSGVIETASGLQYEVLKQGTGASPTDGDITLAMYKGTLRDGTQFDASQQPTPLPVTGMIPGFTEALKLMKKGGKYRIWIKPELGYGAEARKDQAGKEVIPANSLLVFEVELFEFMPQAQFMQMMQQQQQMGGGMPGGPPPGAGPPQGR
ncbi:FKBP-type peptidyl-prolyl cis-trans isomerase [Sphingomonas sp. BT-65]|uniref:FKBP-type peptidyl-prolyl cis-trans isomerase n=1 Tax=Sphingomonas sp. BT-65 TaxID=2989821 RepID=UPI0022356116|nr:FKBP-type peptidyl-prolyl cis-trans isomerase [Sphingomonas sp. BT-65]MCW4463480.1 FKBP-type peptidyl-prolyl cis-trans isomerase [Sphingomonas sp. BT-65]